MSQTSQGRSVLVDGRIVWTVGSLFGGRKKTDMNTRQPIMDNKTGEQVIEFGFGLAVPKSALGNPCPSDPAGTKPGVWIQMHEEAYTLYPSRQIPPSFAMKYSDGDGVDHNGKPFNTREGHAGCIILKCTTRIPIKFFKHDGTSNALVPEGIKCGDYVRVQVHIKAHPAVGTSKAGLYLNPGAVQFLAYGTEIINTPSGDDIFGTTAPPIPAGGSAMPLAPAGGFPAMPGQPAAFAPPPAAPGYPQGPQTYAQPPQQPVAPPPMAPPPHHGVLPPAFQPPPGGQPMGYPAQAPAAPPVQYQQPPAAPGYFPPQNFAPQPQYQQPMAPPPGYQQPPAGMPPIPR